MPILTSITESGAVMAVPTDNETAKLYLTLHEIIPDDLLSWSADQFEAKLSEATTIGSIAEVLIMLAHHKSAWAMDMLKGLRESEEEIIPPALEPFSELAYAESLSWLGYNYIRQVGGLPVIEAVSATA